MSDIHHERIVALCDGLKFLAVPDVYANLAETAAQKESSYIEYLEQVLRAEHGFRQSRSRHTLARLAGFPAIKTLEDYRTTSTKPASPIQNAISSRTFASTSAKIPGWRILNMWIWKHTETT